MSKIRKVVHPLSRGLICFFLILFLTFPPGYTQTSSGGGEAGTASRTASNMKSLLSDRGQVLFGDEPNSIMVIDYPENIKKVEEYLEMVDTAPQQVHIEARVVEVKFKNETSVGIDWTLFADVGGAGEFDLYSDSSTGGITTKDVIDYNDFSKVSYPAIDGTTSNINPFKLTLVKHNNLDFVLRTLASKYDIDVVSAPSITTVNNNEAVIKMTNVYPWAEPEISGVEGTTTPQVSWTINFQEAGIILTVIPTINADGEIIMDLTPEISEKSTDYSITTTSGTTSVTYTVPVIETRQARTRVVVGSGETLIIGGLIKNKNEEKELKIPLLGDIPYLGYLFKTKKTTMDKRELLIFVSPTVIEAPQMAYSAELEKKVRKDIEGNESKLYKVPLKEATLKATEEEKALAEKEAVEAAQTQAKEDLTKKKIDALYSRGVSLYFNQQFKQAEAMFKEILRYDPEHKGALSYLEEKLPAKLSVSEAVKPKTGKLKKPVQQEPSIGKKTKETKIPQPRETDKKKVSPQEDSTAKKTIEAQAKELYKSAVSLYKEKQYNEAFAKFQELEVLSPGYGRCEYYLTKIPELIESQNRQKRLKEAEAKESAMQAQAEEVYKTAISLYKTRNYNEAYTKFEEVQKLIPGYRETGYYLTKIPQILEKEQKAKDESQQKSRKRVIKDMLNSCE